jgi:hypothetical protein
MSSGVKSTEYRHSRSLRKQFPPLFLKHFLRIACVLASSLAFLLPSVAHSAPDGHTYTPAALASEQNFVFEIRNGNFTGTALLDKQTRRI